jgi:hypothetical protein
MTLLQPKYNTNNKLEMCLYFSELSRFRDGVIALGHLNSESYNSFVVLAPGCHCIRIKSLDDSEFVSGVEVALGQQFVTLRELMYNERM